MLVSLTYNWFTTLAHRGMKMTARIVDALTESAGLVSVMMNAIDSDLSLDDERSRLGIGVLLSTILGGLESAMLALTDNPATIVEAQQNQ